MEITYKTNVIPDAAAIIELYADAGLKRPTDPERINRMYTGVNLVITAWHQQKLVGVARSHTDFCWSCYLADLAISKAYQKEGIGKKLISLTKQAISDESMLLLLSVPTAMEYYPKVGFEKSENAFIINRLV